jgi:5-methylthioadenosine/S-adenosylhomocysteine deaminase
MADIIVENASWLVTMDEKRRIIRDGALAIEGDKIIDVGKTADVVRKNRAEAKVDVKGKLVLPGLIDAHVHTVQQLARGMADGVPIQDLVYSRIWPWESNMTSDDAYWSVMLCNLELIKAGTTCFIDPGNYYPEQTAKVTGESGLRGVIARSNLDIPESAYGTVPEKMFRETTDESLKNTEQVIKDWSNAFDGRVKVSVQLRSLAECSDALCVRTKEIADKYNVEIQTHVDCSKRYVQAHRKQFGMPGIERLDKLGVLNPNMLLIHVAGATVKGMLLVKEHGAKVVICPATSLHEAGGHILNGVAPEMLELGIPVAIGNDAAANCNFLDVVRAMHIASTGFKEVRVDATIMPPETVLEMATINGAKAALWDNEIGSLEIGKKADISIFDMKRPEWVPVHNPISNLVYCASGSSAHTLIVNGKILMENRVVKTMDEEKVLEKAQEHAEQIAQKSGLTEVGKPRWPVI